MERGINPGRGARVDLVEPLGHSFRLCAIQEFSNRSGIELAALNAKFLRYGFGLEKEILGKRHSCLHNPSITRVIPNFTGRRLSPVEWRI